MKPKAILNLAMVRGDDGLLRLEINDAGREVVLDPLAELVWDLSEGSRSFEDLAQAASRAFDRVVHKEEVFSALDFLADAGLIEERVAPPAAEGKVSRRSLLIQIAPVVGAGACMMLGASARAGGLFQSREGDHKEYNNKEYNKDQDYANKETAAKSTNRETAPKSTNEHDRKDRDEEQNSKEWGRKWYRQHEGLIDHTGKYAVAANHILVGKWKFAPDPGNVAVIKGSCSETCIEVTSVWTFSSQGIMEEQISSISYNSKEQDNWKYTSTGPRTGVLEEFLGELVDRGDIRWIGSGRNEFEYTFTFSHSPYVRIGNRLRFVRD